MKMKMKKRKRNHMCAFVRNCIQNINLEYKNFFNRDHSYVSVNTKLYTAKKKKSERRKVLKCVFFTYTSDIVRSVEACEYLLTIFCSSKNVKLPIKIMKEIPQDFGGDTSNPNMCHDILKQKHYTVPKHASST